MNDLERAELRHKAKTDLYFLGSEILGYDFVEEVHRPVCDFFVKKDPDKSFEEQDAIKDRLLLDPREHYKTTIDVCDIVQWIICFPDIRIAVFSGAERLAKQILAMAARHFYYNEKFKELFPEHALPDTDEPNIFEFTTPARERWFREPTVSISTIESTSTGGHYEVIKYDDIITPQNTTTPEMIQKVKDRVADTKPLVMGGGYRDFIGTRYDLSDAYGQIIDNLANVKKSVVEIPFGEITTTEDDIESWKVFNRRLCTLPLSKDSSFLFPLRKDGRVNFNYKRAMKLLKDMEAYKFGCQYINDPLWGQTNSFSEELMRTVLTPAQWMPLFSKNQMSGQTYKTMPLFITVDLAFSENKQSDFTVIAVGGFDRVGRLWLVDLTFGKWSPDDFLYQFLMAVKKWSPFLNRIGIEEAGGAKLITPALRMAGLNNVLSKIDWWPLNPKRTKYEHILGLLPLAKTRKFLINKEIPCIEDIVQAFIRFPKGKDDIPDAIAMMLRFQSVIDTWHPQLLLEFETMEQRTYMPTDIGYGLVG